VKINETAPEDPHRVTLRDRFLNASPMSDRERHMWQLLTALMVGALVGVYLQKIFGA
jgi:hypothetical protein